MLNADADYLQAMFEQLKATEGSMERYIDFLSSPHSPRLILSWESVHVTRPNARVYRARPPSSQPADA